MSIGSVDPKAKRQEEFKGWFDSFTILVRLLQSQGKLHVSHNKTGNFTFANNAIDVVNQLYWRWMDAYVRPMVGASNGDPETNIDRYKICSLIELTIITLQPIESNDSDLAKDLNARLAYHCATTLISSWGQVDDIFKHISPKVAENHLTWLRSYDPENKEPPIFSNAVTWQLIHENCLLRIKLSQAKVARKLK